MRLKKVSGHDPVPGRITLGSAPVSGRKLYGTTLRCSCGMNFGKVSNESPSTPGGRDAIREVYAKHAAAQNS